MKQVSRAVAPTRREWRQAAVPDTQHTCAFHITHVCIMHHTLHVTCYTAHCTFEAHNIQITYLATTAYITLRIGRGKLGMSSRMQIIKHAVSTVAMYFKLKWTFMVRAQTIRQYNTEQLEHNTALAI